MSITKEQVRPARDLRNNYADVVKTLDQHEYIVITNQGRGDSIIMDIDKFAKYEQAWHNEYIYNELQKSKALLDDPNVERIPASEVFARVEGKLELKGSSRLAGYEV